MQQAENIQLTAGNVALMLTHTHTHTHTHTQSHNAHIETDRLL
jgi:hypothetical protein